MQRTAPRVYKTPKPPFDSSKISSKWRFIKSKKAEKAVFFRFLRRKRGFFVFLGACAVVALTRMRSADRVLDAGQDETSRTYGCHCPQTGAGYGNSPRLVAVSKSAPVMVTRHGES